jgi:hypothetical protein
LNLCLWRGGEIVNKDTQISQLEKEKQALQEENRVFQKKIEIFRSKIVKLGKINSNTNS